jgi:uncharacterized protein YndB with AHSA1/START domain
MKSQKLTVQISKPVAEVFEFVTNPANTPKWIDFISKEETNEWPVKLETIYTNRDKAGELRDLEITEFEQDKMFVLTSRETGYNVRYTLKQANNNITKLEYYEWMDNGELKDPFTIEPLKKLKSVLEKQR